MDDNGGGQRVNGNAPSGMRKINNTSVNSSNSRIQAIKNSQEEEEHYYNKNLVNDE